MKQCKMCTAALPEIEQEIAEKDKKIKELEAKLEATTKKSIFD